MRISTTFVALAFTVALGRAQAAGADPAEEHALPIARDQQSGDRLMFKTVSLATSHTTTHKKPKPTSESKTTSSVKTTKKQQFDQQNPASSSSTSSTQRKSTRPSAKPAIPVAQFADPVTLPQQIAKYLADVGVPGLLTYKNLTASVGVGVAVPNASSSSVTSSSASSTTTTCATCTGCSGQSQACPCSSASSTTTSSSSSSQSTASPVTRFATSSSSSSLSTRTKTGAAADLPTLLTTRTIIATVSGTPITTNVLVPMLSVQGIYTIGENKRPSTSSSKTSVSTRAKVAAAPTAGSGSSSSSGSGSGSSSDDGSNAFPGVGQNPVESAVSSLLSVSAQNNVASASPTASSSATQSSIMSTSSSATSSSTSNTPSSTSNVSTSSSTTSSSSSTSSSSQTAPPTSSFASNDSLTQALLQKTHIGTTVDDAISELKDMLNTSDQATKMHARQVESTSQQFGKAGSGPQSGKGDGSSIPDLTPQSHAFVQQQLGNAELPYAMALEQAFAMAQGGVYGSGMSQQGQPPFGIQIYNQPTLIQAPPGLSSPTALVAGAQQLAGASSSSSQSTVTATSTTTVKATSTATSTSSAKTVTSSISSANSTSSASAVKATSTSATTSASTQSTTSSASSTTATRSSTSATATAVKLAAPLRLWTLPTTFDSLSDFSPIVKFTSGQQNLRVIEGGLPSEAFVQVPDEAAATDDSDDEENSSSSSSSAVASATSSSTTISSSAATSSKTATSSSVIATLAATSSSANATATATQSTVNATGPMNQLKGKKTPTFDGHAVMTASDAQSAASTTASSWTSTSISSRVNSTSATKTVTSSITSGTSTSSSTQSVNSTSTSTSTAVTALAEATVSAGGNLTNATGPAPLRLYRASAAKYVPASELKAAEAEFLQMTDKDGKSLHSRAMRSVLEVTYPAGSSNPAGDIVGGAQFYALTSLTLPTNNKTLANLLIANITSTNGTLLPSDAPANVSSRPLPPLLAAMIPGLGIAQTNLTSSAPLAGNATGTALGRNATTLDKAKQVTFSYSVWFPPGFHFVKGGKLPGLYGGRESCSGGDPAADCWSSRMMWRANGTGELYLYVPQQEQDPELCSVPPMSVCDSNYGVSVGRGSFKYHTGAWTHIQQTMKMGSTPTTPDGGFEVVVDGVSRFKFDKVVYPASVKGIFFSTFFGGHGDDWATPVDQKAWFRDFKLSIDA